MRTDTANGNEKDIVAEIRASIGEIRKGIADLNQPVFPHRDGMGFSQWLGAEDEPVVVKRGGRSGDLVPTYPPGYQKFSTWRGLSGGGGPGALGAFLKDGFRNWKSSSWQEKYAKAYAPHRQRRQDDSGDVGSHRGRRRLCRLARILDDHLREGLRERPLQSHRQLHGRRQQHDLPAAQ